MHPQLATDARAPQSAPAVRARRRPADEGAAPVSRKEAIIAAAITLFASRPYRDVSVDEIVERAGVAHGMVSYHFSGKRGLFTATVSYIWDDLVAYERRRPEETQPDAAVRGYLRRHFDYVTSYPERFAILSQASQDNGETKDILEEARVIHLAQLTSVLGCRSDHPQEMFPLLRGWNAFVDQVTIELARGEVQDIDGLVELCLQVLVASICAMDGFRFDQDVQVRALQRVTRTLPANSTTRFGTSSGGQSPVSNLVERPRRVARGRLATTP